MTEQGRVVAGRYRLGERIGTGAMGIVWRARDERLRRTVAVKQLLIQPGLDDDRAEEARLRAMREARIAARLQHPNAVTVYDVAEDDDQPWLIMEYVPSRSLAAAINTDGALPPHRVAAIGAQVAAALDAAHAVGVVHRDVKPGNVLLGDDGIAKITDFGISRATDDVALTATGLVTGTPAYLAPELARGETPSPACDVFSLGSTLYAAVEGRPPFGNAENQLAVLHAVAAGKITPPENAGQLTELLLRLLANDPDDRPTMAEAQRELADMAAEQTVKDRDPVADPSRAWTRTVVAPVSPPQPAVPAAAGPPTPTTVAAVPTPSLKGPTATTPIATAPTTKAPTTKAPIAAALTATAPAPARRPSQRRSQRSWRRRAVVPAGIVALLLVVAVALTLVVRGVDRVTADRTGPPPPTAAQSSAAQAPPPADAQITFASMSDLVSRYYALLPGNTAAAYRLLSAGFRARHTMNQFNGFYATIARVSVSRFRPVDANKVLATVNFTKVGGGVSHEPYEFTVVASGGELIIDNAVPVGANGVSG